MVVTDVLSFRKYVLVFAITVITGGCNSPNSLSDNTQSKPDMRSAIKAAKRALTGFPKEPEIENQPHLMFAKYHEGMKNRDPDALYEISKAFRECSNTALTDSGIVKFKNPEAQQRMAASLEASAVRCEPLQALVGGPYEAFIVFELERLAADLGQPMAIWLVHRRSGFTITKDWAALYKNAFEYGGSDLISGLWIEFALVDKPDEIDYEAWLLVSCATRDDCNIDEEISKLQSKFPAEKTRNVLVRVVKIRRAYDAKNWAAITPGKRKEIPGSN